MVLQSARILNSYGHTVYAADSTYVNLCLFCNKVSKFFKLPPAKEANYKEVLIDIIKKEKIDLLIPTCEEIFYISAFLDGLKQYCEVFCDEQSKLLKLHDKWSFYQYLESKDLKTPKTYLASQMPGILDKKYIIKPRFSRFAAKVRLSAEIDAKIHNASYIVQNFIKGQQYCSYALVKNGKILSCISYVTILNAGRGAGILLKQTEDRDINAISAFIAKDLDFSGQLAFDFIKTEDGELFIIECNPRMTSGLGFVNDNFLAVVGNKKNSAHVKKPLTSLLLPILIYMPLQPLKTLKNLKEIFSAKETVFDIRDLLPFFMQIPMAVYWLIKGIFHGGPTAASTVDIEFNGDDI
ncbi:MAG: ATP-grasp domain-containing protein [Campylobacteraceae bacterium]|jgi:predicted ATP-grasp superfamily ATP-dependent carboligase|nr:ATP-grasp domain-containing protein [Campylobacteraceae bacterium]